MQNKRSDQRSDMKDQRNDMRDDRRDWCDDRRRRRIGTALTLSAFRSLSCVSSTIYDKHQEELFQVNQRRAKLILAYA